MRTLASILGAVGLTFLFPVIVYGQTLKINFKDIPPHTLQQWVTTRIFRDRITLGFDIKGDGFDSLHLSSMIDASTYSPEIGDIILNTRPYLATIDLNGDQKVQRNEIFEIDYTNSQTTNPIRDYQNKKPEEKKETPKLETKPQTNPQPKRENPERDYFPKKLGVFAYSG